MMRWIRAWVVPGAVFQSVIVGGGYGTGREVVEFISRFGPLGGLVIVFLVGLLWGVVLAVTFEIARRFRTPDYLSFFRILLGRYWALYEIFFGVALVLILAVCGAAAGAVLNDSFGWPVWAGIGLMIACIGVLNYFGRSLVEKTLTVWGIAMTGVFIAFLVITFNESGDRIIAAFETSELMPGWQVSGFQFFLYNIGVAPAILFATTHLEKRSQAIGSGFVAGFFGVLPALLFHLAFMAEYPAIVERPLPMYWMMQQLGLASLLLVYIVVLFGTIAQTGVGVLQGLNERLDVWWKERTGSPLSSRTHLSVAIGTAIGSLLLANFGIIALVAKGYGYLAWLALATYVLPVLTIGFAKLRH